MLLYWNDPLNNFSETKQFTKKTDIVYLVRAFQMRGPLVHNLVGFSLNTALTLNDIGNHRKD